MLCYHHPPPLFACSLPAPRPPPPPLNHRARCCPMLVERSTQRRTRTRVLITRSHAQHTHAHTQGLHMVRHILHRPALHQVHHQQDEAAHDDVGARVRHERARRVDPRAARAHRQRTCALAKLDWHDPAARRLVRCLDRSWRLHGLLCDVRPHSGQRDVLHRDRQRVQDPHRLC